MQTALVFGDQRDPADRKKKLQLLEQESFSVIPLSVHPELVERSIKTARQMFK
jgi:hypothetical protein